MRSHMHLSTIALDVLISLKHYLILRIGIHLR